MWQSMSYDDISNTITATTGDQGGRSWQPFGEGKSGHKIHGDSKREAPKARSLFYYRVVFKWSVSMCTKAQFGEEGFIEGGAKSRITLVKKNRVFISWSKPKVLYLDSMGRREIRGEKCQNQTHACTGWFFKLSVSLCTKTKSGGERFNEKGAKSTLNLSFSYFPN